MRTRIFVGLFAGLALSTRDVSRGPISSCVGVPAKEVATPQARPLVCSSKDPSVYWVRTEGEVGSGEPSASQIPPPAAPPVSEEGLPREFSLDRETVIQKMIESAEVWGADESSAGKSKQWRLDELQFAALQLTNHNCRGAGRYVVVRVERADRSGASVSAFFEISSSGEWVLVAHLPALTIAEAIEYMRGGAFCC